MGLGGGHRPGPGGHRRPARHHAAGLKATIKNPRGSVEKLSPKESVKGAHTVLRSSVRAPKGFSEGKPEVFLKSFLRVFC